MIVDASSAPLPEVGFVAGKRVGNAVRRNRAKRRMRAAAQHARFDQGHAYVVVASPEVPEVAFETLVEWLTSAVDTARTGETA